MKVKAVDIARKLNVSKATVSLALNNRPGVSEKTREQILKCMEELQSGITESEPGSGYGQGKQTIKLIVIDNKLKIVNGGELDLWNASFSIWDREIKRMGYTLGLTYVKNQEDVQQTIKECNEPDVAGVILIATEMRSEQFDDFRRIKKPLIVHDNNVSDDHLCVSIDGVSGVRNAVDYLVSRGCRDIRYLGNTMNIYNFEQRRAGYRAGLRKNRLQLKDDSIILIGDCIETVKKNMQQYLAGHRLPDAFIMENYQVSIGVIRAMMEERIEIPRDVSLIGVDELPEYMTGELLLTTVKVEHAERAQVTSVLLEQEIQGKLTSKFKVYSNCQLLQGNSVK